jgi:hypothetical protein
MNLRSYAITVSVGVALLFLGCDRERSNPLDPETEVIAARQAAAPFAFSHPDGPGLAVGAAAPAADCPGLAAGAAAPIPVPEYPSRTVSAVAPSRTPPF